ncbi:gamma-glutamyltransferase [Craurococcus roseus]|uniref:Glutathione hydrolase proenzyme n=1 Tax=Craurococcus roseus TaxID=77585 RepID=A0ABN1EYX2_9PROT
MARLLFLLLLLLPAAPAPAQTAPAIAGRHMLAVPDARAAEAGLAVLREGGSAVDAAIAAQAVLTLVEPHASGIGGGALMLHWDAAARRLSAWDGREVAPAAATPDLFLRPDGTPMGFHEAAVGGRAVGVPGALRMLEAAHREHGRLPWARLFAPAVALAEEGFAVSPRLADTIAREAERLGRDPAARAAFLLPDGSPPPAGHRLRSPALAATLRAVAEGGADALHRGPVAAAIAQAVRTNPNPGGMTPDELAGYAPVRREALCAPYRVFVVCGFPPPSSGGVATLQILSFLSHQDMPALGPLRPGHGAAQALDAALLLGEAGRLAFADRNRFLADADVVPVPVRGLLDPVYLLARAQMLDRDRALAPPLPRPGNPPRGPAAPPASQPPQPENGTSHLSIVDGHGNAVALTTTVEDAFGARIVAAGMVLNNQLTDFSFLPEIGGRPVANAVAPGKRPRSSMSPTIVFGADASPVAVVGSAGGSRIIGHVAQTLVAMLDWGLDPQEAVALPRVGGRDGVVELEAGTPAAALADSLRERGVPVEVRTNASGLHAIRIGRGPDGGRRLLGGADPRREGVAVGD